MSDEYNGWTNRETWALNLWLGNDQGLYLATQEVADNAYEDCGNWYAKRGWDFERDDAQFRVGEEIVKWVGEFLWETMETMDVTEYQEMRYDVGSLWRVDEQELGEAWIAEDDCEVGST